MSRSQRKQQQPITDRKHVLSFGKWKGSSIEDLMLDEPQYLLWLHQNTEFELGHELLEEAENNGRPDHEFKGYSKRDIEQFTGSLKDFID